MVHTLTDKFFRRFATFFASFQKPAGGEKNAIQRIKGAKNKSLKIAHESKSPPRRLFYCGSSGSGKNRNDSTLGIFLVNAFFPEIIGAVPTKKRNDKAALLLTLDSINGATPKDFLVYHMHQRCDVDVLTFPGLQLHINVSQSIIVATISLAWP